MPIAVNCPNCKALFRLGEELAGKKVRCQKCQHVFVVAKPEPEPEFAESAPALEPAPALPPSMPLPNMEIGEEAESVTAEPPKPKVPIQIVDDDDEVDDEDDDRGRRRSTKPPPIKKGSSNRSDRRDRRDRRDREPKSGSGMTTVLLIVGGVALVSCLGCVGVGTWIGMMAPVAPPPPRPIVFNDKGMNLDKKVDDMRPIVDGAKDKIPLPPDPPIVVKDGAPLPPPPPLIKGTLAVIFNGQGEFKTSNSLNFTDKILVGINKRGKTYVANLLAGDEYQIDVTSMQIDPYLYVADDTNQVVLQDDDGGGFPNARALYRPVRSGIHRFHVTSFGGDEKGAFTFTIRRTLAAPVAKKEPPIPPDPKKEPPLPPIKKEPPPTPKNVNGITHRVIPFKKGERTVEGLIWARDGKSFYALTQNGLLQRIDIATGNTEKQHDFVRRFGNLSLSGGGLLLSSLDTQEVWIVDPENLANVKRKIQVPGLKRVSAGRDAKLAVAAGQGGFGGDFYLLNLQQDKYVQQFKYATQHLTASPDGKYAFAQGGIEQLHRFRIEGNTVLQEDATPRIAQNGQRICVSADSKYVALPSGGGNYNAEGHPVVGTYATYVYATKNLKIPDFVISSGAYPQTLGFDDKSGMVLAQNFDKSVMLFTYTGIKRTEHVIPEMHGHNVHEIVVSPLGFEAILRGNEMVAHVSFKK